MGTICKNICSGLNEDQLIFCQHIGDGPCMSPNDIAAGPFRCAQRLEDMSEQMLEEKATIFIDFMVCQCQLQPSLFALALFGIETSGRLWPSIGRYFPKLDQTSQGPRPPPAKPPPEAQ